MPYMVRALAQLFLTLLQKEPGARECAGQGGLVLIYATSGFEPRLNPRSCVVRPLTTAGSAKMSRRVPFLAQAFLAQEDIGCEDTDGV